MRERELIRNFSATRGHKASRERERKRKREKFIDNQQVTEWRYVQRARESGYYRSIFLYFKIRQDSYSDHCDKSLSAQFS
jgi:hypothetical protein